MQRNCHKRIVIIFLIWFSLRKKTGRLRLKRSLRRRAKLKLPFPQTWGNMWSTSSRERFGREWNRCKVPCWGLAMYPWELVWCTKKVRERAPVWTPSWLPALQAQIGVWTNVDGMGYASQWVEVSNEAEGGGQRARDGGDGGERRHQPMDFDWADWRYQVAISSKTLSNMSSLSLKPSSKMSSPSSKTYSKMSLLWLNLLQRCLHHHQKLLLLYGGKLPFYFILFMYRLYNPLAVGNKRAVKESNEVKTDAEVKAIKEKCERMELDFEVMELCGMRTRGMFFSTWRMCGSYNRLLSTPMRTSLTIAFHQPINFPGKKKERGGSTWLAPPSPIRRLIWKNWREEARWMWRSKSASPSAPKTQVISQR